MRKITAYQQVITTTFDQNMHALPRQNRLSVDEVGALYLPEFLTIYTID